MGDNLDELIGLGVVISLKDSFSETEHRIAERMDSLEEKAHGTAAGVTRAMTLLKYGLAAAGAAGLVFGNKAIEETLKVKGLSASVTALAGDAGQLSEELDQIARKSGVFQGEELQEAGKHLLGMGIEARRLPSLLDAAAKRAAVLGGSVEESAQAFINMRLAMQSGAAPTRALKALGLSLGDLAAEGIRVSKGKVLSSMDDVMDATTRAMQRKFGARAAQVAGGVHAMQVQIGEAMQDIYVAAGEAGLVNAKKTILSGVLEIVRALGPETGAAFGRGLRYVFDAFAPIGHAIKIVTVALATLFSSSEGGIGRIPVKLHDELVKNGLWPLIFEVFVWGERIKRVFFGTVEGIRAGLSIASKVFSPLLSLLGLVLRVLRSVDHAISSMFSSAKGSREASDRMREFGQVLGGVAAAWLSLKAASTAWSAARGAVNSVMGLGRALFSGKSIGDKLKDITSGGSGMPVKVTNWPAGGGVAAAAGGGAGKVAAGAALGLGRRALAFAGAGVISVVARFAPGAAAFLSNSVAGLIAGGGVTAVIGLAIPVAIAALAGVGIGLLLDQLGLDDWIAKKLGPDLNEVGKDSDARYKSEFDEQRQKRLDYIAQLEAQGYTHGGAVLSADQAARRAATALPGAPPEGTAQPSREAAYRTKLQSVIHTHIHLDGKEIHRSVVEHEHDAQERTHGAVE